MVTVLKNNLFSIIFGIIAILAVSTLFWPIPQKFTLLRTALTGRSTIAGKLDGIAKQTYTMPLLSPDQSSQDMLTVFPAQKVIDAGVAAMAKAADQANLMQTAAVNANKHDLLLPGSLPTADDAMKYKFVQTYVPEITGLARWQKILNSGTKPTQPVIDQESQKLHDKIIATRVFYVTNGGVSVPDPASLQAAENEYNAKLPGLKADVALENAKSCQIYLDPGMVNPVLPCIPNMNVNTLPDIGTMWDAQLAMWINDDVTKQIARVNHAYADSDVPGGPPIFDVLHTPIKALLHLDRPGSIVSNLSDKGAGVGGATPRVYPLAISGRVSNALYDVLRFKLTLIVDAAKLPQILHGLEAGQFFTINNVQINGVVDPAQAAVNGFRYGNKPVITVELDCEELLMHDWTKAFVPDVRTALIAPMTGGGWSGTAPTQDNGNGGDNGSQDNPDMPPQ